MEPFTHGTDDEPRSHGYNDLVGVGQATANENEILNASAAAADNEWFKKCFKAD